MSPKEAPPDRDTGMKQFTLPPEISIEDSRPFNHEARNQIEERYAKFLEGGMDTSDVSEPMMTSEPIQEERPPVADTGSIPEQKVETQPIDSGTQPPPSFEPKYKTHEEAEKAYREAERKMHEATQQAAQYRKMVDEQNANLTTLLQQRQAPAPQVQQPQLNQQEVEARFYQDPLNFIGNLMAFTADKTKTDTLREIEGRLTKAAKQAQISRAEQESDNYFKSTHKELVPLEPFVKFELEELTKDQAYVEEVMSRNRNVILASKEMIDKAAERVKTRIPDLKKYFGTEEGGTRERLSASPVVSPNAASTVIAPRTDAPETQQSYMASRLAQQERITTGRIR